MLAVIANPFIPGWSTPGYGMKPFVAELWLIGTIVAVLLTPFFTPRRSNVACALVALAGLSLALISLLIVGGDASVAGPAFRGMLVSDAFAVGWKMLLLLFVIGVILMWFSTTSSTMHEGDGPEFFTLLLGATLGMCLMSSTSNLLMLVMAIEMASLPSYVLAGFRKTNRIGAEASLKYVLFGAATSAIMIYGLTMLYGMYGTLQIDKLAVAMTMNGSSALLLLAIAGLIVGVGFKISAVPFHFWCPDVFEGASIDVSAFLSVASKGAALALLLRVLMLIAAGLNYQSSGAVSLTAIAVVIGTIGAITATVGNTAAFVQNNIKRLLAYSSIAHAGYMLCALSLLVKHNGALVKAGSNGLLEVSSAQALLLYLAVYMFMNLGAFTVAGLIFMQTGSENINDYGALGRRSPVLAICMFCFMISLVGLPPFAGFIAKLNVMYVLGGNGGWWWALVVVIGVNTVFSLYYYMRVVKTMYLSASDAPSFMPNPLGLAISVVCAVMLVAMLIGTGPLTRISQWYGQMYVAPQPTPPALTIAR